MLFDKLTKFFDGTTISAGAAAVTSTAVDFRWCGDDVDHKLFIWGNCTTAATSAVPVTVDTSYDASTWVTIGAYTLASGSKTLIAAPIPAGVRRYVRLTVGDSTDGVIALGTVHAGLVDALPKEDIDHSMVQTQITPATDLAVAADAKRDANVSIA